MGAPAHLGRRLRPGGGRLGAAVPRRLGELLERTLLAEAADLEPPATPPLHLRDAPGLPEAGQDAGALVGALLTPVRSGLILTRWDLGRAAAQLGLGLRMGERAFALRSMLTQDPGGRCCVARSQGMAEP
jgi:hypothetical protein